MLNVGAAAALIALNDVGPVEWLDENAVLTRYRAAFLLEILLEWSC